jgi:putative transposase
MDNWLDMLRSHYNWCIADRIDNYYQQFIQGEYCDLKTKAVAYPLTSCVVRGGATGYPWTGAGKKRNAGKIQDAELPILKKARPWYALIDSDVLQRNIARLDTAYKNFFEGRGFPKFKNRSNFRSFEYKPGRVIFNFDKSRVYLPGIGEMKYFNSRSIPDGFNIRTITIRRQQQGWYMSVRLENKSVPELSPKPLTEVNTAVGLDLGLIKLVHCSDGSVLDNPKFSTNKKTRQLLKVRQRRINRKKKGSKNRSKAVARVAKLHQKIVDRRSAHQWKLAHKVANKADCIIAEDLNIQGMKSRCKVKKDEKTGQYLKNGQSRKQGLNRAISDAAWGELISKIEYVTAKRGKILVKVDPKHTSQTCGACGHVDKASRDREKFICTNCGFFSHADINAAQNIKLIGIKQYGLNIKKVPRDSGKPKEPIQLKLNLDVLETPSPESTGVRRRQHCTRRSERNVPGNQIGEQLALFDMDILGSSNSA